MFWKKRGKPKVKKLPRLKDIPDLVARHLVVELNQNPDWVWRLKGVVRPRPESKDAFDFRVFDEAQAAAKEVTIKDYTSLDGQPELILYEGWFNKRTGEVQVKDKKVT